MRHHHVKDEVTRLLAPSLFRAKTWMSAGIVASKLAWGPREAKGCDRHQRDFPESDFCVSTVSIVSAAWPSWSQTVLTVPTVFSLP